MYGGTSDNFYFCGIDRRAGVLHDYTQSVSEKQQTLGHVDHYFINGVIGSGSRAYYAGKLARVRKTDRKVFTQNRLKGRFFARKKTLLIKLKDKLFGKERKYC